MLSLLHFLIPLYTLFPYGSSEPSIYQVLRSHGLPMGLLPKGVKNFSVDSNSGQFEAHLDRPCYSKFENELYYDKNVTGIIRYGLIDGLTGIQAQELFLLFPVIQIRVDVPSSGLIYFNVGVVSKQFSLSEFETPRDCLAVPGPDLRVVENVSKIMSGKLQYELDRESRGARIAS